MAVLLAMQVLCTGIVWAMEESGEEQNVVLAVNMAPISRDGNNQDIRSIWNQQPVGNINYKTGYGSEQDNWDVELSQESMAVPAAGQSPGEHEIGEVREFTDLNGKQKRYEMAFMGEHCTVWRATISDAERARGEGDIPISDNLCRTFGGYYDNTVYGTMQEAFGDWYEESGAIFHVDMDNDKKTALIFSDYGDEILGAVSLLDLIAEESGGNGNYVDCLWLNVNKASSPGYQELMRSTMAHELQHLINTAYTGGDSDTWLNETFSMSAEAMIEGNSTTNLSYIQQTEEYIRDNQFSCPFIFQGRYAPRNGVEQTTVYGQWYAFGCYLSHQTEGYPGGGRELFKQVLKNHSCTVPSLMKTLSDIGYTDAAAGWENSFRQLVFNYNMALYLNEESGIYSLGDEVLLNNFSYPSESVVSQEEWGSLSIPGGGSMAAGTLDLSGAPLTIEGHGRDVLISVFTTVSGDGIN